MTTSYLTTDQIRKAAGFDADVATAMEAWLGSTATALEILTGAAGSIIADISKTHSLLAFAGTKAFTLPDGDRAGLTHTFICTTASDTPAGTLTVTTGGGGTHYFDTAGQAISFVWTGSTWLVTAKRRVGGASGNVVVGTTVLTGKDMWATYNLSITDTVTSTGTKAIPDGSVEGEFIAVRCTTAGGTPDGNIDGVFKTLAGAAATHLAVNATGDYGLFRWDGAAWQNIVVNSITLS